MRRVHPKNKPPYRPLVGHPYRWVLWEIAEELNKTSMFNFDDLSALRHSVYELWMRVFPGIPFPPDADILRTPYQRDPGTKS